MTNATTTTTTTTVLGVAVAGATWDGLAALWGATNERAVAATTRRSASIWMGRRDVVRAEIERRGLAVRRSFDGGYMVGYAKDFGTAYYGRP